MNGLGVPSAAWVLLACVVLYSVPHRRPRVPIASMLAALDREARALARIPDDDLRSIPRERL